MSSTTAPHGHMSGAVLGSSLRRAVSHVHVTVPASKAVRAAVLADFRKAHGLDLSDDDRADKVRAKRS